MAETLPQSLRVTPNIAWEHQTIDQLIEERDYWAGRVATAPGFASAKVADDFRCGCEAWIKRRTAEAEAQRP